MCRHLVLALALPLLLVSCADGGEPEASPPPEPTAAPTTTAPSPEPTPTEPAAQVLPLTGGPAPDGVPDRAVLVVKVDNSAAARPQAGLAEADLVVEELVEGGMTRLAVMYHSTLPDSVAPVRSVRTSDIAIVAPTGGALVASGGASRVLAAMDDAGLTVVAEGAPGFSRDGGRSSPYNVTLAPDEVLGEVDDLDPPAEPYLPWAAEGDDRPVGEAASDVTVRFSGAHTTSWAWTGDAWSRVEDLAEGGDEFTPDNLLVLRVEIRDAGYTDPAGNFVPETVLEGSGDALLFTAGEVLEAGWEKDDAGSPLRLVDAAGEELPVPPGRTWIELVPEAGDVAWS